MQQQKTRLICSDGFMKSVVTTHHSHLAWEQVWWWWWWCNL